MLPTDRLKAEAMRLGFDGCGVCASTPAPHKAFFETWLRAGRHAGMAYLAEHSDLRGDPEGLLPGVRSIVAVALNYNQPNPATPGEPRIARYALGRDYHRIMRPKLNRLAATIGQGSHRVCVDSAPIFERDYAHLAGLGWFGKNTCLIDSKRGSWFFIGLILTTARLRPDRPSFGGCGTCRLCIDACPTGAIVFDDGRWQVDSRRCISYATIEHRGELEIETHGWTFGCDVCQEVCPFNQPRDSQPQRARTTTEPDLLERRHFPHLVQLAQWHEAEWDAATRGSPVRRAGWAGLRRNARANLESGGGNAGA